MKYIIVVLLFMGHFAYGQRTYDEIQIGDHVWMAENLDVTTFRDGTPIPHVTDSTWHLLTTPAYCWYNNDSAWYDEPYGKLYNYYAINSGELCPMGWRMPTLTEYKEMVLYLDPAADTVTHAASEVAGGMLKSNMQAHWGGINDNIGATNESGMGLLFGGCRSYKSNFSANGGFGYYGCIPNQGAVAVRWATPRVFIRDEISKYVGMSVRCIKIFDDEPPTIPDGLNTYNE